MKLEETFAVENLRLLIEPLWNWNVANFALLIDFIAAFNRTFVELKYVALLDKKAFAQNLLIEPLWNWNVRVLLGAWHLEGAFNRTFVELKYLAVASGGLSIDF